MAKNNSLYSGNGEMAEFIRQIEKSDDVLQKAIENGFDLNGTYIARADTGGRIIAETKPLHMAARFGRQNAVKSFLKRGLNINMKDDSGIFILFMIIHYHMHQIPFILII